MSSQHDLTESKSFDELLVTSQNVWLSQSQSSSLDLRSGDYRGKSMTVRTSCSSLVLVFPAKLWGVFGLINLLVSGFLDPAVPRHTLFLSFFTTYLHLLLFFPSGPFRDCLDAQESGQSTSGMYLIKPDETERPVQVWCEQDIDNGGWTVIQSRKDGSVNFFRNWDNYKVMTMALPLPCPS